MDDVGRLTRRPDEMDRSSYRTAHAPRKFPGQEDEIADGCAKALEEQDGFDAENMEKDKELEIECEQAPVTEYPTGELTIHLEIHAMVTVEVNKSSLDAKEPLLSELLGGELVNTLKAGFNAAKERVKTSLSDLVEMSSHQRYNSARK